MRQKNRPSQRGFTLIELMVAIAAAAVVLGSITLTFRSQHDSSLIQEQVTVMQQNLRSALFMIGRDIRMAGFYTNFETANYSMDYDQLGNNENIRPLLFARDNVNDGGGDNVTDNSDVITIVKASQDGGTLVAGEQASGNTITLADLDLDGDGDDDFALPARSYGILVKANMNKADFFQITGIGANITIDRMLSDDYEPGDRIFRADIIVYRVDNEDDPGDANDNDDPLIPKLRRINLGSDNGFQPVAEGIDQLQFRYLIADGSPNGTWMSNPAGNEANVRAVEIFVLARTLRRIKGYTDIYTYVMDNGGYHGGAPVPNDGPPLDNRRRKLLSSIVCTRNIGL